MSAKDNVTAEVLKLTESERLEVAERIYESLGAPADAEADEEWAREIERRIRESDSGKTRRLSREEAERIIMGADGGTPSR